MPKLVWTCNKCSQPHADEHEANVCEKRHIDLDKLSIVGIHEKLGYGPRGYGDNVPDVLVVEVDHPTLGNKYRLFYERVIGVSLQTWDGKGAN